MTQKIVFMDVDGVFNHWEWLGRMDGIEGAFGDPTKHFDPSRVVLFNEIIDVTGADVVLSTSWRHIHPEDELIEILREVGIRGNIVGETPAGGHYDSRYGEILGWISLNLYKDKYVILDDCVSPHQAATPEDAYRIIQTSMNHGLLKSHVVHAIHVLGEK